METRSVRSDWSLLVLTLKQGQRFFFSHVPNEVALPLCGPARPETQAGEDGGTLNWTGASLGSRTRLCLPGKLRESEAVGAEVPAAPQRGRFVQGSQPGPALMLGPAAHSPRAGPGGEPHSLTRTGTDCASFSARRAPFPLRSGPPGGCHSSGLRARPSLRSRLPPLGSREPTSPWTRRFHSGSRSGSGSRLTFPPPESSRLALPTSGPHTAVKRKCDASREPAPGRSAW